MRRPASAILVLLLMIGAGLILFAAPASAHAVLGSPTAPVNNTQTLTMNVPNEKRDIDFNVDVKILVPAGWPAGCVATQATWTCATSVDQASGRNVVHFTKSGGSVLDQNEDFTFSTHTASNEATFRFPTVQKYNTGEEVAWIDDSGSTPSPSLRTVSAGTPTLPPTTAPPHNQPTNPPTPTPTVTPTTPRPSPGAPTPEGLPGPGAAPTSTLPGGAPAPTTPGATTTTVTGDASGAPTETTPDGAPAGPSEEPPGSTPTVGGADVPGSALAAAPDASGSGTETAAGTKPSSSSTVGVVLGLLAVLVVAGVGGAFFLRRQRPTS